VRPGSSEWSNAVDRVAERTARDISGALKRMINTLPDGAAPQMAIGLVIARLAELEPWFMQLIMEDAVLRESYDAAVARRPVKPERDY
jgi:hypothetical protein